VPYIELHSRGAKGGGGGEEVVAAKVVNKEYKNNSCRIKLEFFQAASLSWLWAD
jgi:hypothetical protein